MLRRVSRGLGHELGLGLALARPAPGSYCRDPLAVKPVTVSEPLMKARARWDRRRLRAPALPDALAPKQSGDHQEQPRPARQRAGGHVAHVAHPRYSRDCPAATGMQHSTTATTRVTGRRQKIQAAGSRCSRRGATAAAACPQSQAGARSHAPHGGRIQAR